MHQHWPESKPCGIALNRPSRGALLRFLVAEGLRLAEAALEGANHA